MVDQTRGAAPPRRPDLHRSMRRITLKMVRPSILDIRFRGDSWVVDRQDGTFTLFLGDFCLASITAVPLDLHSLNQTLDRIRHRRPRPHKNIRAQV
jgi:hypothetical protein